MTTAPPFLVNLIGNSNRNTGIGNDMEVFMKGWKIVCLKQKIKVKFRIVDYRDYKCQYANMNVFFENVNPVFYPYANRNIFIPNQEFFFTIWDPYLKGIDEVWCKTKYGYDLFKSKLGTLGYNASVKYISWTTFIHEDKVAALIKPEDIQKKKREFLLVAGKSKNKNAEFITRNWDPQWPQLHVYYIRDLFELEEINQDNITYHREFVSNRDLSIAQNTYWFHLCASSMEGFGHYINEARERGAYVITTAGFPMKEFECPVEIRARKKKLKDRIGCKYNLIPEDFISKIQDCIRLTPEELQRNATQTIRKFNNDRKKFQDLLFKVGSQTINSLRKREPPLLLRANNAMQTTAPADYPEISIVTVTKNRKELFPLPIDCINKMDYPHHRIQWIIVEDGDHNVKDIVESYCSVPAENIVYERHDGNVGEKRNRGVSLATKEFVFMMDDDDYYKPNYIKQHISLFRESELPCHVCSTIGVFHLTKMYSMINTPPLSLAPEKRVSEATLAFRKSFWERRRFPEVGIAEGEGFLSGRMEDVVDISWDGIFVSFLHDDSTSGRDTYKGEPNGCHFGFSDRFFEFVTNLASLHTGKKRKVDGGDGGNGGDADEEPVE